MIEYKKYDLVKYNTMRLHCVADHVCFPESQDELILLLDRLNDDYIIIAGGSNIILPPILHLTVVLLVKLENCITFDKSLVKASASVRIQTLIREAQKHNLGGCEYLFSVPCTVGGAVYMNAGRGSVYNQSLADFIQEVECYNRETHTIEILKSEQCRFSYRHSVFHNNKRIILNVILKFNTKEIEIIERDIQSRISISKNKLDADEPSCGSVFKYCNDKIMHKLMGLRIGGACWSEKTSNWIKNDNHAKYWQIICLIKIAQILHKVYKKKCIKEVIVL